MTELLDPPISLQDLARISVADFHRADELGIYGRHAVLIRGLVTETFPMSPLHLTLSKRLYDRLLRLDLPGCSVRQDGPLPLRDSEPRPDVAGPARGARPLSPTNSPRASRAPSATSL